MFEMDLSGRTPEQTLGLADEIELAANRAEAGRLQLALRWADLHGALGPGSGSLPGMERLVALGGDGTPQVAEFAPAELGARWRLSPGSAALLVGDALDLRHRLPRLWARVLAGDVLAWVARRVAQATRAASVEAAAHVDRRVAPYAHSLSWQRLEGVVDAALVEADPQAAADAARAAELAQGVWVGESTDRGIKDVHIRTEAAAAVWFDAAVDRVADALGFFGDADPKEVRRARAVGVLARPDQALDLYDAVAAAHPQPADQGIDGEPDGPDDRPTVEPTARGDRGRRAVPRPKAVLYVHLSQDAVEGRKGAAGAARVEGVGPVTAERARRWLGHCQVRLTPSWTWPGRHRSTATRSPPGCARRSRCGPRSTASRSPPPPAGAATKTTALRGSTRPRRAARSDPHRQPRPARPPHPPDQDPQPMAGLADRRRGPDLESPPRPLLRRRPHRHPHHPQDTSPRPPARPQLSAPASSTPSRGDPSPTAHSHTSNAAAGR
jgi:hypothetical protein